MKLDERLPHRYSGHYSLATWRFAWESRNTIANRSIDVRADSDSSLRIEYSDGDYATLIPVSQHAFQRHDEREATSGFFEENGRLFFQEGDNWVKVADLNGAELDDATATNSEEPQSEQVRSEELQSEQAQAESKAQAKRGAVETGTIKSQYDKNASSGCDPIQHPGKRRARLPVELVRSASLGKPRRPSAQ